eukprot:TRINITY_DN2015_c0_g1_i4.p1 TRINITY_DN2015_c0_g1~~TRINITY_DN2015_c0_g1_i4.p1  ORF type:complete len:389 (-),score=71.31 TRINITY_DN2015_c0_g1_i4:742-1908(-)
MTLWKQWYQRRVREGLASTNMSRLDCGSPAIHQAIQEISSGKSTDWCCVAYEAGSTTKVKLSAKGTEGFEELQDNVHSGRVQFFYIRFDVGGLPKFCMIGFCDASVPGPQRGNFNNHYQEFSKWLKDICRVPIHYQFPARDEEELEETKILKQLIGSITTLEGVSKGGPAVRSGGRRPLPVVNVTQRDQFWSKTHTELDAQRKPVNKVQAIDLGNREQFWQQNQQKQQQKTVATKVDIDETARQEFWQQNQQQQQQKTVATKIDIDETARQQFWQKNQQTLQSGPIATKVDIDSNQRQQFWQQEQVQQKQPTKSVSTKVELDVKARDQVIRLLSPPGLTNYSFGNNNPNNNQSGLCLRSTLMLQLDKRSHLPLLYDLLLPSMDLTIPY